MTLPSGYSRRGVGVIQEWRTREFRHGVLRGDLDAARLRLCARQSGDGDQVRRLLALAAIYDDASRAAAAVMGGVTRQIVRDWVERFNAGGPDALVTRKAPGKPPLLSL